jgi:hypothetical protein
MSDNIYRFKRTLWGSHSACKLEDHHNPIIQNCLFRTFRVMLYIYWITPSPPWVRWGHVTRWCDENRLARKLHKLADLLNRSSTPGKSRRPVWLFNGVTSCPPSHMQTCVKVSKFKLFLSLNLLFTSLVRCMFRPIWSSSSSGASKIVV